MTESKTESKSFGNFDDSAYMDEMAVWRQPGTTRRTCQHCKQPRDCRHGPDPYLFNMHEEIEEIWLCAECFTLREDGSHLPDDEDDFDDDDLDLLDDEDDDYDDEDDESDDDEDEDYEDDEDDYDDEDDDDYEDEADYDDHDLDDDE